MQIDGLVRDGRRFVPSHTKPPMGQWGCNMWKGPRVQHKAYTGLQDGGRAEGAHWEAQ